jgi:hypothetical protein
MRAFSSAPYRLLRLARDHYDVRYPLAVLTILALIAIGVAGAHDWPAAPSAEQPRLSAIELGPAPRPEVRKAKPVRAAKKPAARRALRRKSPSVRASLRRGAVAGRGAHPSPVPAARRDDRGATPVRAPVPARAGEDEDDDRGGGDGDGSNEDD